MAIGFAYRVKVEEEASWRLSEPYRRYLLRTKRLIPFSSEADGGQGSARDKARK